MFKTLLNAFKVKELRNKLGFIFLMLVVIRLGSNLPVPGVKTTFFKELFDTMKNNDAIGWFNTMTGGSFEQLSVFALSITPYITSSIIMQLLGIAIPQLEELQKDEDGRKKIQEYTRYVTVGLSLIESIAMSVGFASQGLIEGYNEATTMVKVASIIVAVVTMTAGSAFLMWIGEQITDKGIGNGISMVLLFNIISSVPNDINTLFTRFVSGKSVATAAVSVVIIIIALLAITAFTVVLNDAKREIPVQYSKKMQGRKMIGGQTSSIPLKVNTAGVIPVIFASSLMSMPVVIGQLAGVDPTSLGGKILRMLNSGSWCNPQAPKYSIGLLIYIVLLVAFAYFYTSITFNPLEVANNMKKQGGFIPGIRPGKPTSDYLNHILNYIIFIGAVGLTIVAVLPIVISGVFTVSRISFSGTSLIIIVGVVLETTKAIESQMVVRNYKSFLA